MLVLLVNVLHFPLVATGKLSDEMLLNIFHYFLNASPQLWPRLVHICRKWRHIVFANASQQALYLRLFYTHGTSVLKTLDYWPALPIVLEYGGSPALDPPAPEDENNIVVALKQYDRVSSIHLTISASLLEKLHLLKEPFSKLEDLLILSMDDVQQTLPSTFRWGPHLSTLHLTGIALLTLHHLLLSSKDLVDIQLHEIGNISSGSLLSALFGMTQLQSLSNRFQSFNFLLVADSIGSDPISGECVILPTLTCFKYQGTNVYFDSLVARIDSPHLVDIEITFLEPMFDVSNLRTFIDRIEVQNSHHQADILFSENSVSICLTQPILTCLKLQVSCKTPSQQLFSVARFASFLLIIRPFRSAKWLHLAGDFSTDIVLALYRSDMRRETVLPAMHKLCIREPEPHCASLRMAVVSFMVPRWLSGHLIAV